MRKIHTKSSACPSEALAERRRGFVLLFAVTLAGLLLAIALGVVNVAEKEIKFGTSARDTGVAFLAADTGVECAIFHDKSSKATFPVSGQETSITCGSSSIPINFTPTGNGGIYDFVVPGLGVSGGACAKLTLEKDDTTNPAYTETTIVSKGYNVGDANCEGTQSNRVERQLQVRYTTSNPTPPTSLEVEDVVWTNAIGVSVSGNNLTKTAPGGWGNGGASSAQSIPSGDGYVEFSTGEISPGEVAGLSNGDPDQEYTPIDFGINPNATGAVYIYENGTGISPGSTFVAGDTFRISVESGVVKYYKNGALLYTSTQAPTYPLLLDTSLNGTGATVTNAQIAF